LELNQIKKQTSDLQTFLSFPHLISKENDEEKYVEKLGSEGKFSRKSIIFTARIDENIKMKSIGDVVVDDIKSDVAYVKERGKKAQIVGQLTRRTNDRINLNCLAEIDVKVGYHSNVITGCTILENGKEHNVGRCIDRVTLNDSNGNFIRSVQELNHQRRSFYDVISIDRNTIALSIGSRVFIVDIYTQSIVHIIKNNRYCTCLGIAHCDGKLY
jgi:hypothetical protein